MMPLKRVKKSYQRNQNKNLIDQFLNGCKCQKTFDLPPGSYSFADIQDYFEFIIKKHETLTENPPVQIYSVKLKTELFSK